MIQPTFEMEFPLKTPHHSILLDLSLLLTTPSVSHLLPHY